MNKQAMKVFSKDIVQFFCDKFPVIIFALLVVCFPCCNSVSYDSHCLIFSKQTSNMIITKILTVTMQYIFIHKKL